MSNKKNFKKNLNWVALEDVVCYSSAQNILFINPKCDPKVPLILKQFIPNQLLKLFGDSYNC